MFRAPLKRFQLLFGLIQGRLRANMMIEPMWLFLKKGSSFERGLGLLSRGLGLI